MCRVLFQYTMDISTISDDDFICLVANYNDLLNGEKNKISPELLDRGYTEQQLALVTGKITEQFNPVESCGVRFTKPFGHIKYDLFGYVLILFENYKLGLLPFLGAVSDQPAQIMELFNVLQTLELEAKMKSKK